MSYHISHDSDDSSDICAYSHLHPYDCVPSGENSQSNDQFSDEEADLYGDTCLYNHSDDFSEHVEVSSNDNDWHHRNSVQDVIERTGQILTENHEQSNKHLVLRVRLGLLFQFKVKAEYTEPNETKYMIIKIVRFLLRTIWLTISFIYEKLCDFFDFLNDGIESNHQFIPPNCNNLNGTIEGKIGSFYFLFKVRNKYRTRKIIKIMKENSDNYSNLLKRLTRYMKKNRFCKIIVLFTGHRSILLTWNLSKEFDKFYSTEYLDFCQIIFGSDERSTKEIFSHVE